MKSLYSKLQAQQTVNQRKEQVRGWQGASYKLWQVVKVAFIIPVLDKFPWGNLSSLKPVMVKRIWDRIVKRLVPVAWDRGCGASEIPPAGECLHLNKAEYKYPSPKHKNLIMLWFIPGN